MRLIRERNRGKWWGGGGEGRGAPNKYCNYWWWYCFFLLPDICYRWESWLSIAKQRLYRWKDITIYSLSKSHLERPSHSKDRLTLFLLQKVIEFGVTSLNILILLNFSHHFILINKIHSCSLADGTDGRLSVALRPPVLYRLDVIHSVVHQQQEFRVFLLHLTKKEQNTPLIFSLET